MSKKDKKPKNDSDSESRKHGSGAGAAKRHDDACKGKGHKAHKGHKSRSGCDDDRKEGKARKDSLGDECRNFQAEEPRPGKGNRKHKRSHGRKHPEYSEVAANEAIQLSKDNQLAKPERAFTVGILEEALLREFPAEDACVWDRTGLVVGERGLAVNKVAVALDATVEAVRQASKSGADVLVTHHPAFLDPPTSFSPAASTAIEPGALVWEAIRSRVALMDFHTALDVSPQAQAVLPSMLGLRYTGRLIEPTSPDGKKGFGQICKTKGEPESLSHLAARATSVFGRPPRVWGNFDKGVRTIVTATGSAGEVGRLCIGRDIDCLVCGEVKYHEALALSEAGLTIIELGHDVSELPLVAVLAEALAKVGIQRDDIVIIDQSNRWSIPEAIRV